MIENDIIQLAASLPGVVVDTASEASGAPDAAWGDGFVFYDPEGDPANHMFPFATIVTKNYDGFDIASNLNRPGAFRLNIEVGPAAFADIVGYPVTEHRDHDERWDYAASDRLMPHPVYGKQGWVSIINPGEATDAQARSLLADAHARAARRHRPPR